MMRSLGILGVMLYLLFGPVVWAAHFSASYAAHAALCASGDRLPLLGVQSLPALLGGATLLASVTLVALVLKPHLLDRLGPHGASADNAAFLRGVMRFLSLLSLVGVAWSGVAMLVLPLCQQLR